LADLKVGLYATKRPARTVQPGGNGRGAFWSHDAPGISDGNLGWDAAARTNSVARSKGCCRPGDSAEAPEVGGHAIILVRKTIIPGTELPVFETFAFLSTVGFAIVFIALVQADRASRRADDKAQK
jgi:hypothetical protein